MVSTRAFFVLGVLLIVGLAIFGAQIGHAVKRGREFDRYLTVLGLSEREAKATLAIWPIRFSVAAEDLGRLKSEMEAGRTLVMSFLNDNGIKRWTSFSNEGKCQRSLHMKKKKAVKRKPPASATKVPDWVLDDPPGRKDPPTKQALDELVTGVQLSIEDTPAWKDLVRRLGKKEATRVLKLAIFSRHSVQCDPNN